MNTRTSLIFAAGFALQAIAAQAQPQLPQPDAAPSAPQSEAVPSRDLSSGGANTTQAEAGMEQQSAPSPFAHLKPVTQNDVTYLCGGVGADEASYMKHEAKDYDLMLTFAARDGSYLADVDVDIKNAKGDSVLQASCDAPILLVDLPKSGNYRVRADAAGYTLNQTVKVSAGKTKRPHVASAVLSWPQQAAEAHGSAATSTGASGVGESGERASGGTPDSGTR